MAEVANSGDRVFCGFPG